VPIYIYLYIKWFSTNGNKIQKKKKRTFHVLLCIITEHIFGEKKKSNVDGHDN
jgi:hypothetical protein